MSTAQLPGDPTPPAPGEALVSALTARWPETQFTFRGSGIHNREVTWTDGPSRWDVTVLVDATDEHGRPVFEAVNLRRRISLRRAGIAALRDYDEGLLEELDPDGLVDHVDWAAQKIDAATITTTELARVEASALADGIDLDTEPGTNYNKWRLALAILSQQAAVDAALLDPRGQI